MLLETENQLNLVSTKSKICFHHFLIEDIYLCRFLLVPILALVTQRGKIITMTENCISLIDNLLLTNAQLQIKVMRKPQ